MSAAGWTQFSGYLVLIAGVGAGVGGDDSLNFP